MFESSSGGYRRLNRSGSGFTQNFTFFGILVGLVIIFSVFYLYTSASNDASTLRFELKSQSDYVTKLKNEVMDLNVKLEELRTSEVTCKESKAMLERQAEECSTKLKQAGERAESSDTEKSSLKIELESLRAKNTELSSILDAQKVNMSAMKTVGVGQEAIVLKLNDTVDALRRDLILKDEIIKKLESAKSIGADAGEQKDVVLPPNVQRPSITTKSTVIAAPVVADNQALDVLPIPGKAQAGDRVKIEEANQKKENDRALLEAAQQQDGEIAGIDPPNAFQGGELKSRED